MFSKQGTKSERFATRKEHLHLTKDKPSFSGSNHKADYVNLLNFSPPVHATCRVPNGSKTEPGCFIYDDNKNCSRTRTQITLQKQIFFQLN